MKNKAWPLALVLTGCLTSCGGGGSSSPAPSATGQSSAVARSSSMISSASVISSLASATSSALFSSAGSSLALALCAQLTSDPDGDGVGFEQGIDCKMRTGFDITADMGVGWNLGNTMDATGNTATPLNDETYWGNPKTTKANIDAVKAAGFNTLRLPVSWDDHMSGSEHKLDAQWLDRVEEIANYALDDGMYVIINIHHNNGWEMPTTANEASAKDYLGKIWPQIADRFNKFDHHVIFETMNEPRVKISDTQDDWTGKAEYYSVINRLNATALAAIRATGGNNAKRLVMIPGYAAAASATQVDAITVPDDRMVAISTHAYSPYDFALKQDGGKIFINASELDTMFSHLNSLFIAKGVPVIMGEWASTDKGNSAERVKHAAYYVKAAEKYGIPTIWWDNGNFNASSSDVMGLLNRNTNSWTSHQDIVNAIMENK